MKLKIFFCQFPNPLALRVSGIQYVAQDTVVCMKSKEGLNIPENSTNERSPFNVSMGTTMYICISYKWPSLIFLSLATGRIFIQTRPPTQTPQSGAIPQILYVREEEKTIRMVEDT